MQKSVAEEELKKMTCTDKLKKRNQKIIEIFSWLRSLLEKDTNGYVTRMIPETETIKGT